MRALFSAAYREYEERFGVPEGVAVTWELLLIQADAP
jgi:hypothetical protein